MPTPTSLSEKNPRVLLAYSGRGNPPSVTPAAAISNFFPGLELDFRAVWKNLLVGVELHESWNLVATDPSGAAFAAGVRQGTVVESIDGQPMAGAEADTIDWSNTVAGLLYKAGTQVPVVFRNDTQSFTLTLEIRRLMDGLVIADTAAAEPGSLTQGLCSPWQADYRECGCFYWAASRPDFVNVDLVAGKSVGQNWMQKNRQVGPKAYQPDGPTHDPASPQVTYEDLYRDWEQQLRFVIGGKDEG